MKLVRVVTGPYTMPNGVAYATGAVVAMSDAQRSGMTTADFPTLVVDITSTAPAGGTPTVTAVDGQTGSVDLTGEYAAKMIPVTVTADYTAQAGNYVRVDATAATRTVTLPAATAGRVVAVHKIDPSGNPVLVAGTINGDAGGASLDVQHAGLTVEANGSSWEIVALPSAGTEGPTGPQGGPGSPGSPGANGATWLSGSGAPASGLGNNGDLYLDTAASAYYGPKTAGAWGSAHSIIGATGPTIYPTHVVVPVFASPVVNTSWTGMPVQFSTRYNGGQVASTAQNASRSYDVLMQSGTYTGDILHFTGTDAGIYTVAIDGTTVMTIDGYAASGAAKAEQVTGIVIPGTGLKRVSITMATKNSSSTSYAARLSGLSFTRTGA